MKKKRTGGKRWTPLEWAFLRLNWKELRWMERKARVAHIARELGRTVWSVEGKIDFEKLERGAEDG